ncbi:hypothetical protein [Streptomyces sp. NPDC059863]|uniref:hypothetical protein n=1 Tax=unclassified Streptomyces TaxID=2593676 RepID=UPI0036627758
MEPEIEKALELARLHKRLRGDTSDVITELHVSHAASLGGLKNFPELEVLILVGCDPVSPSDLPRLEGLVSLRINDSALRDVASMENLPRLRILRIQRNFVRDLTPLLECALATLEVAGNPLSEESCGEVLPKLVERGCEVSCSGEREWRATLRLWSANIPLSCYENGGRYYLCSPGLGVTKLPDYDHPEVEMSEVEGLLDRDPTELLRVFESRGGIWSSPDA